MAKYRERWEKLKESAKKKRAAKDAKETPNDTIPEEQEPEPEAETSFKSERGGSGSATPAGETVMEPSPTRSGLSSHVLRSPESIVTGVNV
jgi:hypothetical protein